MEGRWKIEGLFRERHAEQFKQSTSRQRKLNKKGWCRIAEGLCIRLSIWHFIL